MQQDVVNVSGNTQEVLEFLSDAERIAEFNKGFDSRDHVSEEMLRVHLPVILDFHRRVMQRLDEDGVEYTEITARNSPFVKVVLSSVPLCDSNIIFGEPIPGSIAQRKYLDIPVHMTGQDIIKNYEETEESVFHVDVQTRHELREDSIREPDYLVEMRGFALKQMLAEMSDEDELRIFGVGFMRDGLLEVMEFSSLFQRKLARLDSLPLDKIQAAFLEAEAELLNNLKTLVMNPLALVDHAKDFMRHVGIVSLYLRDQIMLTIKMPPTKIRTEKQREEEVYHFRTWDLLQNTVNELIFPVTALLPTQPPPLKGQTPSISEDTSSEDDF